MAAATLAVTSGAAAQGVVGGAPCSADADACVDLSAEQAWLMGGGAVTYGPTPVRHGMPGYETPPGTFEVTFKSIDHWSTIYDAPMPYSVFFNGGIAFHEGSLDRQSHGCVRMTMEGAQTFFAALSPGDVVEVVP
ncbi:L,D-transpeptidase [Rhodococcus sp. NPDC058514]|uniref:L,D-transpeptidase n=1 Tax=unclassified Rhodococcus (in: high G+C Gram-positive bacteria) TaxID=192944 RepID=UPI00365A32C2